jgi:hypothetical protein
MDEFQQWHLAWARFDALRTHQPTAWDESAVQQYHEIVTALEEASPSDDLSSFRVPDSELQPKVTGFTPARLNRRGSINLSQTRYCNDQYMRRQIEGIALYFHNRQPSPEPRKIGF